jgi:hypothetical protein
MAIVSIYNLKLIFPPIIHLQKNEMTININFEIFPQTITY